MSWCELEDREDAGPSKSHSSLSLTLEAANVTEIFSIDATLSQRIVDVGNGQGTFAFLDQCADTLVALSPIAQLRVLIARCIDWFEELSIIQWTHGLDTARRFLASVIGVSLWTTHSHRTSPIQS